MITSARFPLRRLKYAASINDQALPETTDLDFELAYIDISNVDSQGKIHDIASYRFEAAPSRARRVVQHGDVIISTVRTYLQAIAAIENPAENLIVSTGFAVVRPGPDLVPEYCKYALRETRFLWEVKVRSTGVSYPAINASDLGDIPIHLPTLDSQRIIAAYLDKETARIDQIINRVGATSVGDAPDGSLLALLAERRSALISAAVAGQISPEEMTG